MTAALERLARAGLTPVPPSPPPAAACAADVGERGRALLAAQGICDPSEFALALPEAQPLGAGFAALVGAVGGASPSAAREAAFMLTGLGPGLTPLGDDLLAGAAVAVCVLGRAAGLPPALHRRLPAQLAAAADEQRTTRASAALLELAARGWAVPRLHDLVDLSEGGEGRWRGSLALLRGVGSTSGRGWALAAGAACAALSSRKRENPLAHSASSR